MMAGAFDLYTTPLSANGRKVLAASHHLGLAPRVHLVNVYRGEGRSPGYLAINPSGRIPTLVEDRFVLSESNAILQYLAEVHGDFRLSSRDPRTRAGISSWLFWESAHWQPALIGVLSPTVGHHLLPEAVPAPSGPVDWEDGRLVPLLDRLETHLGVQSFLAGDSLTIADFSVAGMTTYFRVAGFPFERHPALAAWSERVESLEAWRVTEVDPWR